LHVRSINDLKPSLWCTDNTSGSRRTSTRKRSAAARPIFFQQNRILPMGFTIDTTWEHSTNDKSHENPDTPGTKLKVFRNNLKILYHPIFNWLYQNKSNRVVVPGASSENYTCMYMTLNIKRHINFLIRHIIYQKSLNNI